METSSLWCCQLLVTDLSSIVVSLRGSASGLSWYMTVHPRTKFLGCRKRNQSRAAGALATIEHRDPRHRLPGPASAEPPGGMHSPPSSNGQQPRCRRPCLGSIVVSMWRALASLVATIEPEADLGPPFPANRRQGHCWAAGWRALAFIEKAAAPSSPEPAGGTRSFYWATRRWLAAVHAPQGPGALRGPAAQQGLLSRRAAHASSHQPLPMLPHLPLLQWAAVWHVFMMHAVVQPLPLTLDYPIIVSATLMIPYAYLCYQEALDWHKWTKEGCSFLLSLCASFDPTVCCQCTSHAAVCQYMIPFWQFKFNLGCLWISDLGVILSYPLPIFWQNSTKNMLLNHHGSLAQCA